MQMTKNKHAIVKGVTLGRSNLIELIILVILAALGVNLIAGYLLTFVILSPVVTVVVGVILCVGSVLYLAARLLSRRVESRTYEAFLVYNKNKNEIILVPRYDFSERIYAYMKSASVENSALKILWEKEPLKDMLDKTNDKGKRPKSAQLLSEVTEYFVLNELSVHLTDYFAAKGFKKGSLKRYGREDIPEVLLKNRYLELFSRSMEDRPAFMDVINEKKGRGEVVYAYGTGGVLFDKFDLVLPKKSIIRRLGDNRIEIEMQKLKLSITVRFEGFCTVLPVGFEQYYLRLNDFHNITEYKLNIDIQVLMKSGALFSRAGWEYYHWVDSFLDEIDDEISEDAFFSRLNWESVFTVLQCLEQAQSSKT